MLRFLHPCLKEFVGFVAASHVRPFSSSSALCKEKQPATPKVPVPPPTSGVPAQGGMAATAVAEAKRGMTKIAMLMGTVDKARRTPGLRLAEEDKEQLRTVFIVDFSNLDAVMTELEWKFKMVLEDLVEDTKQTFAMQSQVPQVCWLCTCVVDA